MTRHRPAVALGLLALATLGPLVAARAGVTLVGTPVSTLAAVLAGYLAGAWLRPPVASAGCLAGAVALTVAHQVVQAGAYSAPDDLFFFGVLLGGTALAGSLMTARATQVRELRRTTALVAEQRAREVRAAALEERNRVEADVTASLMQRIGAVLVQASGARVHAEPDALVRIEEAGRAALDELRTAVGSLRTDSAPPPAEPVTPAAVPRLGPVDVLVGLSGVPVVIEAWGSAGPVSLLGLLVGAPLVWRRQLPLVAVAAAFLAAVVTSVVATPLAGLVTPLLPCSVAAYAVGAHLHGRSRLLGAAFLVAGSLAVGLAGTAKVRPGDGLLPTAAWLAVATLAGVASAQHARRAEQIARLLARLEEGRDSDLRLAAAEQRNAVARDLHDTVAHAMTVVCLHAGAAQRSPGTVHTSLAVVESAARDAMTQLRAGLEVLEPAAGLADEVRALAATLGVGVRVEVEEEPVSPGLVLRVVREALVNAARHAPGATVTVMLRRDEIEVCNGPGTGASFGRGTGTGLAGLEGLLAGRGGRLEHGPLPDGGFRVTACLPTGVPA